MRVAVIILLKNDFRETTSKGDDYYETINTWVG